MKIETPRLRFGLFPAASLCAASLYLAACGGNPAFIAERSRSEGLALKSLCHSRPEIPAAEISRADSLMEISSQHGKQGKSEMARQISEEAIGLYQLALARNAKAKSDKELAEAEAALAKEKDRLETYREILAEMKTMRKP